METTQPRPLTADQVRIDARSRQARRLVKKLDWLHWVLIGIVVWLGFTLWIEPYRYLKLGQFPVRVNRISGATERLFGNGWKPMVDQTPKIRNPAPGEAIYPQTP